MTAICGMIGTWAGAVDAGAHMAAMLRALGGNGETWLDPAGDCRLGIANRFGGPRPRVLHDAHLAAVVDGRVFDHGDNATADRRLFELWTLEGPRVAGSADAQFALAIWDGQTRRLTLARDALGVRSLYFHADKGGVVFASTIEALLCHPAVPRDIDERAVSHFLTFLSVPVPSTLFARISKLPPGSFAVCGANGIVRTERAWDMFDRPVPEVDDMDFYVERARTLHRDALATRVGDAPAGALLSGGNDSSANVALMAKLGQAPHTFTVGLAELEGRDEFSDIAHAAKVAKLVGSKHHQRLITIEDFIKTMPRVIDAQDDLVSEPSSVFLHHALAMVREQGLRVVITGEANDEISCGHGGMINVRDGYHRRWRPLMALPRLARSVLARVVPYLSPRHSDILARAAGDGEYFWSYEIGWTDHDKHQILTPEALERTRDAPASHVVAARARSVRRGGARRDYMAHVIGMMMQDHYLGNLMLGKLEQLSSRLGIEARCPYTAPSYVHFVYNIPERFKTRNGEVKSFFKRAIGDLLPHEIVYRPKQGFRTPTPELFRGVFGDWAKPLLLETGFTRAGILSKDALAKMFAEHRAGPHDRSTRLWTALVLNLWHERWAR